MGLYLLMEYFFPSKADTQQHTTTFFRSCQLFLNSLFVRGNQSILCYTKIVSNYLKLWKNLIIAVKNFTEPLNIVK